MYLLFILVLISLVTVRAQAILDSYPIVWRSASGAIYVLDSLSADFGKHFTLNDPAAERESMSFDQSGYLDMVREVISMTPEIAGFEIDLRASPQLISMEFIKEAGQLVNTINEAEHRDLNFGVRVPLVGEEFFSEFSNKKRIRFELNLGEGFESFPLESASLLVELPPGSDSELKVVLNRRRLKTSDGIHYRVPVDILKNENLGKLVKLRAHGDAGILGVSMNINYK